MKPHAQTTGATQLLPYHLSVGIVLLNEDNNIICLHYPSIDELKSIYTLPQKTMKVGETLENAVKRVARQEAGAEVSITAYLGSIVVKDLWWKEIGAEQEVEKTTVYFLAQLQSHRFAQEAEEENMIEKRELCEISFNKLIDILKTQKEKDGMRDFNQLEIVLRAKKYLEQKQ